MPTKTLISISAVGTFNSLIFGRDKSHLCVYLTMTNNSAFDLLFLDFTLLFKANAFHVGSSDFCISDKCKDS